MSDDAIRRLSSGELLRRLINNLSSLVDREVDLAKAEARQDVTRVGTGAAVLGFGLLLLYSFVAALIVAAIFAIAGPALAPVTAALMAAAVFLVLGIVVALIGWSLVRIEPMERTRESVREDVQWARRRVR